MVTIYSTPACSYCGKAKEFFNFYGVAYVEHNVAEDEARREEMIQMTGARRVPVLVVDDEVMTGFTENEARLKELLNLD